MFQLGIIHYDIAAVVIMSVTLLSLIFRKITTGPTSRVYLSATVLVLVTAVVLLAVELNDLYAQGPLAAFGTTASPRQSNARDALMLVYFALRTLTAPAYLILIATVSGTTHRLNSNNFVRIVLWAPMLCVVGLVITNPLHHLVYFYTDGIPQSGPLMPTLYASAGYYSLVGIYWLIRWRAVFSEDEFATLLMLYPIILVSVFIQYLYPELHIEMFVTSIAMMLISAFVIQPEKRIDSLVHAGSLQAYRDLCQRSFYTEKRRCLVYLEIVNLEQLRDLVGKDELQNIMNRVADNLIRTLEGNDLMYYLRNGLFCIAPLNTDADHALEIALKTHEEGKARSNRERGGISMTGMRTCIVRIPEDASDMETLNSFLRRFAYLVPNSDVVMFSDLAKRDGFALEMALSDIVSRAIEQRSFEVHYQPIWCVHDGCFHSAEALVRLNDPEFGWIRPDLFIPEAEQNGLIIEIGSILLEKICQLLGEIDYEGTGLEYVEVNLSVEQCIRPDMADKLIELAQRYEIDPSRMNLEVTETSSSFSQAIVSENMRVLAEAGFTFSLDDYGTGYSNVTRMLNLPFSLVKIDKSFVDDMDDPSVRAVFSDTVAMLKEVGKAVLVEGVETKEQVDALGAMGVDYIQGYYFSKPLPEREFIAFLTERNC